MSPDAADFPEIASEALVVVDLVESTATSNLFGWYTVGRVLLRDLRALIAQVGNPRGLSCMKSTGDGYLLAFRHEQSAAVAVLKAVEAMVELLSLVELRNRSVPHELVMNLRVAIHFGEVDVVPNDREGPNVSFAFRIEGISGDSLLKAVHPLLSEPFPATNYVLCSEAIRDVLEQQSAPWKTQLLGLFKLKGFHGRWEIFRLYSSEPESL